MTSKPKLTGSDIVKKHKPKNEEPRISDSFQELFGTPITKTSKISPDSQKVKETKKDTLQKSDKGKEIITQPIIIIVLFTSKRASCKKQLQDVKNYLL